MRSVLVLFAVSAAMLGLALTAGCTSETADAGPTEKIELDVQGMTCGGCAGTVQAAIEKLPGVKSCDVSWEENKVVVEADPKLAQAKTIIAASVVPSGQNTDIFSWFKSLSPSVRAITTP